MERPTDCVRVAVRVRPFNAREHLAGSTEVVTVGEDGRSLNMAPDRHFTFDRVLPPNCEQETVFTELAGPLIDSWLEGYNCTILAYGQTGSGKTFTMGTNWMDMELDLNDKGLDQSLGIVPRAISLLINRLTERFQVGEGESFELYVSFLELYNEEIVDLLNAQSADRLDRTKRPVLAIREDPNGIICVTGIKEERVQREADILELLRKGSLCRTTKSTDMNLVSSRSHAIFTLLLWQRRHQPAADGSLIEKKTFSKLHFVDLAGSERLKRTNVVGDRARESISINSGLLALGNVISALGDESKRATHVPYRDSKLTRLLQDSLGGNNQTLMIACISPASDNHGETLNTLKYANRAKNIRNTAHLNEEQAGSQAWEIMQLKKQVAALKAEILQLRGSGARRINVGESRGNTSTNGEKEQWSSDEIARLRGQLRELQRKYDALAREKLSLEAERDFYRSAISKGEMNNTLSSASGEAGGTVHTGIEVIKGHLRTIADLRTKIATLESNRKMSLGPPLRPINPATTIKSGKGSIAGVLNPETPAWFNKANDLIDRTRDEIRNNEAFIETLRRTTANHLDISDDSLDDKLAATAITTRCSEEMTALLNDRSIKEELIVSLENSQQEYLLMRRKYEERLRLLQENIQFIQRERDQAVHTLSSKRAANSTAGPERRLASQGRLEERIRQLGRTIEELKSRNAEYSREIGSRTGTHETILRNLRAALQTAKSEKMRLQGKVDELTNKLQVCTMEAPELADLRARERKSGEQAKRYKKAYEFQKNLLHKRSEQYLQAKARIRLLVNALRQHRIPLSPSLGNLLETPSLKNLILPRTATTTTSASNVSNTPTRNRSQLGSRVISLGNLIEENDDKEDEYHHDDQESDNNEEIQATLPLPSLGLSALSLAALDGAMGGGPSSTLPSTGDLPSINIPLPSLRSEETPHRQRKSSLFGSGRFIDIPSPPITRPLPSPNNGNLRNWTHGPGKDLFSRIADAASLTIATRQSQLLGSTNSGTSPLPPTLKWERQPPPSSSPPSTIPNTASPMKIDP